MNGTTYQPCGEQHAIRMQFHLSRGRSEAVAWLAAYADVLLGWTSTESEEPRKPLDRPEREAA